MKKYKMMIISGICSAAVAFLLAGIYLSHEQEIRLENKLDTQIDTLQVEVGKLQVHVQVLQANHSHHDHQDHQDH